MYATFDQVFDRPPDPGGESPLQLRIEPVRGLPLTIEAGVHGPGHAYQILSADRLLRHRGIRARWFIPHLLALSLSPPGGRATTGVGGGPMPMPRDPVAARYAGRTPEQVAEHALVATLDLVVADPGSALAARVSHIPHAATLQTFQACRLVDPASPVVDMAFADPAARPFRTPVEPGLPVVVHADRSVTGRSALAAAERLRRAYAGPLTLAVTHGLFVRGVERLSTAFDRIITFAIDDEPSRRPHRDDLARPGQTRTVTTLPYRLLFQQGPVVDPTR